MLNRGSLLVLLFAPLAPLVSWAAPPSHAPPVTVTAPPSQAAQQRGTPPDGDALDRNARVARAEAILRLGTSRAADDMDELIRVLAEGADWERVIAAKAVRPSHAKRAVPLLMALQNSTDPVLEVEATIALHRLQPTRESLAHLERLRDRGSKLRVALQTGEQNGRPLYDATAASFFRGSVAHRLLMTRLDGALGLVEMGGAYRKEGLAVLQKALESHVPDERRLAVRVLRVQYDEPGFVPLLESAATDPDETVRTIAQASLKQLGRPAAEGNGASFTPPEAVRTPGGTSP